MSEHRVINGELRVSPDQFSAMKAESVSPERSPYENTVAALEAAGVPLEESAALRDAKIKVVVDPALSPSSDQR